MKININNYKHLILKNIVCLYIISLCLGSATRLISKNYYVYILGILGLVQCIHFFDLKYLNHLKKILHNRLLQFYIFWFFYGSILFAIYKNEGSTRMELYKTLLVSVFTGVIIIINIFSIKDVELYMKAMIFAMFINFGISFLELAFGIHISEIKGYSMINKTFVGLANPNNYATLLLYSLCFLFIIFANKINKSKSNKKNTLIFILSILTLIILYLEFRTGSMTGVFGVLLFLVGGFFINFLYKKFNQQLIIGLSWVFVGMYFLVFILILLLLISNATMTSIRLEYLNNSINEFLKTIGLGLGPGGSLISNEGWLHNLIFEMIFDYGFIIGFMFLTIIGAMIINWKKNILGFQKGFIEIFLLLLPFIWISSSSALSLHFTWVFITLIYQYIKLSEKQIVRITNE